LHREGIDRPRSTCYFRRVKKEVVPSGINGRALRPHNRAAVLRLLQRAGPISRTDLGKLAGLAPTTITNVVAELIQEELVVEQARPPTLRRPALIGRPAIDLDLVQDVRLVLSVQLGVGRVVLAVCDLRASVVARERFEFDPLSEPSEVLGRIGQGLRKLIRRVDSGRTRLLGVGVGVPGPVEAARRVNRLAINLGWRDIPIADYLEPLIGLPVVVEHNVRGMALAAAHYGLGQDAENLAFIYLETGIAAGLILDRKPYGSGQFGHLQVDAAGRPCRCGSHGCLETVVSQQVLIEQVRAAANDQPRGRLALELRARGSAPEALFAAARAADPVAVTIVERLAEHIGAALASLVNLLSPELIILGGLFSSGGDLLLDPIRKTLRARAFPALGETPRVELSIFGADAWVIGAAAAALEAFFYSSTPAEGPWDTRRPLARAERMNGMTARQREETDPSV
jgi:predicted NBD/HSP70 family sugar kinase